MEKNNIKSNEDSAIIKELQEMTKDEATFAKSKRKIRITMILMLILNFIAGLLIIFIYFTLKDIIFLIIGGVLILTGIPIFIILRRIEKKIAMIWEIQKSQK